MKNRRINTSNCCSVTYLLNPVTYQATYTQNQLVH